MLLSGAVAINPHCLGISNEYKIWADPVDVTSADDVLALTYLSGVCASVKLYTKSLYPFFL